MSKTIQPLEWVDDLKLGDYALDNHTKEFLRFANILIDARNVGNGEEQLDNILNNLTEYSHKHFPSQEDLMERIHYPSFEEHKADHKKFNLGVAKLLKKRLLLKRTNVPADEYDERGVEGVLTDITNGAIIPIEPLPPVMIKLLQDGGLVEHIKKNGDFKLV